MTPATERKCQGHAAQMHRRTVPRRPADQHGMPLRHPRCASPWLSVTAVREADGTESVAKGSSAPDRDAPPRRLLRGEIRCTAKREKWYGCGVGRRRRICSTSPRVFGGRCEPRRAEGARRAARPPPTRHDSAPDAAGARRCRRAPRPSSIHPREGPRYCRSSLVMARPSTPVVVRPYRRRFTFTGSPGARGATTSAPTTGSRR
jgi:hypothetical protein